MELITGNEGDSDDATERAIAFSRKRIGHSTLATEALRT